MNYHGKMMNIPTKDFPTADWEHAYEYYPEVAKAPEVQLAYKYGHRDARHAAAEIALEADRTIEELQEENAKLVATLTDANLKSTLELNTELIRDNGKLRAALEEIAEGRFACADGDCMAILTAQAALAPKEGE